MEVPNAVPNHVPPDTSPPPGFRELTEEESRRIENLAFRQLYHQEKISRLGETARAADAEAKLAKLERQKATAELSLVRAETIRFEQGIGVFKAEDRLETEGKVYVRIQAVKGRVPDTDVAVKNASAPPAAGAKDPEPPKPAENRGVNGGSAP